MAMYEDSMDVNGVAWQRLEGHPVYGSGRLGMDNAGRVVARQGGILIGCVDIGLYTWIEGFKLVVNGNVVVNAYFSSVKSLVAAIEATGVYEAYWDGYLLKLWYIGGNPTATWVVLANKWVYTGLGYTSTKLSVELCVDEGEMLSTSEFRHVVGAKVYEVTNHLGNVLATVSDRRERTLDGNGVVSGFGAVIKSTSDYWPFGSELEGRQFDANRYKFGFGGQEADQEIAGDKSMYTAQFWEYDAKIGRRWNVDPIIKHSFSTYSTFSNNPIIFIDPMGNTDYYYKGNYVGTDGVNNNVVGVISDKGLRDKIREGMKQNGKYVIEGIDHGVSGDGYFGINRDVLKKSQSILINALKNGANKEFMSVMENIGGGSFSSIFESEGDEGSGTPVKEGDPEPPSGDASIHSHPTGVFDFINEKGEPDIGVSPADKPSTKGFNNDVKFFKDYDMNIIVGRKGENLIDNNNELRTPGIFIFDNKSSLKGSISGKDASKILKGGDRASKSNKERGSNKAKDKGTQSNRNVRFL